MNDRIHLLDALRGFSLAGICVAHFSEQYLGNMPPAAIEAYARHGILDNVIETLLFILVRGKGFALFSFMFGVSLALQMTRARTARSEAGFYSRFAWRLTLLFAIGTAHLLVYRGDILTTYALLGFALLLMSRAPGRWLLIAAAVLFLGAPRVFVAAVSTPLSPDDIAAKDAAMEAQAQRHWNALQEGRVVDTAWLNLTDSWPMRLEFQYGVISRGYQTLGYFLLGLWAGRRRVLERIDEHILLFRRTFRWGAIVTLAVPLIAAALAVVLSPRSGGDASGGESGARVLDPANWAFIAGITVYDLWNLAMTLCFVAAFVLLFRRERWQRRLLALAPVGKLALSNYLLQSIVGGALFFGWGLGLLGEVGSSITLPLALVVFFLQMRVSRWWLARYRYGPVEWAWRSLTRLRAQPFRLAV